MTESEENYQPHSILLTGGAGFIGSNVCNHLTQKYPDVKIVCLDCLDYCSNMKNLGPSLNCSNFVFIKGNILNIELVSLIMQVHKIDTVLHFAAQSHVDRSFGNSLEFTQTNVLGTHTLLECSKKYNIKRFIHVSTDEVYGEVLEGRAPTCTEPGSNRPKGMWTGGSPAEPPNRRTWRRLSPDPPGSGIPGLR